MHCDTRLCHHLESRSIVSDVSLTKLTMLMRKQKLHLQDTKSNSKIQLLQDPESSGQHSRRRLMDWGNQTITQMLLRGHVKARLEESAE